MTPSCFLFCLVISLFISPLVYLLNFHSIPSISGVQHKQIYVFWNFSTAIFLDAALCNFRKFVSITTTVILPVHFLLTPWSRVFPEKLICCQLVKKFPAFYGTQRFITAFAYARHLSLSWARSIHSIPYHSTSWRSTLILFFHLSLVLPSSRFPSFPHQNTVCPSPIPHTCYIYVLILTFRHHASYI
jgi:hypothetical protein